VVGAVFTMARFSEAFLVLRAEQTGMALAWVPLVMVAMNLVYAATAPSDLRGTAYGLFNLVSGVAMLLASVLAGWLWDRLGASFTFYAGAVFCILALLGLIRRPADCPPASRAG
jgi:MFS family permease